MSKATKQVDKKIEETTPTVNTYRKTSGKTDVRRGTTPSQKTSGRLQTSFMATMPFAAARFRILARGSVFLLPVSTLDARLRGEADPRNSLDLNSIEGGRSSVPGKCGAPQMWGKYSSRCAEKAKQSHRCQTP